MHSEGTPQGARKGTEMSLSQNGYGYHGYTHGNTHGYTMWVYLWARSVLRNERSDWVTIGAIRLKPVLLTKIPFLPLLGYQLVISKLLLALQITFPFIPSALSRVLHIAHLRFHKRRWLLCPRLYRPFFSVQNSCGTCVKLCVWSLFYMFHFWNVYIP